MSKSRGFTKFSVFLKRNEGVYQTPGFVRVLRLFLQNQERAASKFGSTLGRDRGLVNNCSAAAGRAPNWTGRTLDSSYKDLDRNSVKFEAVPKRVPVFRTMGDVECSKKQHK